MDKFRVTVCFAVLAIACVLCGAGCGRSVPADTPANMDSALKIRQALLAGASSSGGPSPAASQQSPTGFATLRGVFKLSGNAPPPVELNIDKEPGICKPGGQPVYAQQLVVDSATGGIANIVIYASDVPEAWMHESAKPGSNTDEVVFDQKQCVFLTHVLGMQTSQKLKIHNSDPTGHNTNLSPDNNPGFNRNIPSGTFAMYEPTAEESRPFAVTCNIHRWMQAWIITRNDAYFAVTKADGTFEIPNLPAGVDLEFRVWQEKAKVLQNVTVNGQPTTWSRGRFTKKLDAGDESQNQLEVVVDASVF